MADAIRISDIVVADDRSRRLDSAYAMILADSISRHGLMHPIAIRRTPNAKGGKFTLVSGLHRLEALRLTGAQTLEAGQVVIVQGDAAAARKREIEENLARYDLTVLDRAMAVLEMRQMWEAEHGPIERGNPDLKADEDQLGQVGPIGDESAIGTFLQTASDRIGISDRAVKRLVFIAQKLLPELRAALHGRAEADNQSILLRAAKQAPEVQRGALAALTQNPSLPLAEALDAGSVMPKASKDPQTVFYSRAYDTFFRMTPANRRKLLVDLGVPEDMAREIAKAKAAKGGGDA